jgi:hypothetical protein
LIIEKMGDQPVAIVPRLLDIAFPYASFLTPATFFRSPTTRAAAETKGVEAPMNIVEAPIRGNRTMLSIIVMLRDVVD